MSPSPRTRGPDFLDIGPPKTGTTWLFDNLQQHPDIWLPVIKELHWFDEVQAGGPFSLRERMIGHNPAADRARRYHRMILRSQLVARAFVEPAWKLRYLLRHSTDDDYVGMFAAAGDRVAGDMTPSYCDLDDAMVARVYALLPAAKIVMHARDPIERAWSDCRRMLGRHRGRHVDDIPHDEIMAFLDSPSSLARSDYVTILDRWTAYYPAERVHVVLLDDVVEDAGSALRKVHRFLGVDDSIVPATVADAVHVGWGSARVPEPYRRHLAERLHEPMRRAAHRFGRQAERWLARADEAIDG